MKLITLFLLLGLLAVSGWAEEYNLEPYSPELVKKAEAGDPKAQFDLHRYFADKWGEAPVLSFWNPIRYVYPRGYRGEQDIKEAAKWLTKSAEQGYPNALFILGIYKSAGLGVTKDMKEAIKLWTKAAEQGFMPAQGFLGSRYASGHGVPQDYKEAVKWYKKAAEQGDADAKEELERLKSK